MTDDGTASPYLPLTVRGDAEAEAAYGALHEGVPDWLDTSLAKWIGAARGLIDGDLTALAERVFRRRLPGDGSQERLSLFWRLGEDQERLALVDLALSRLEKDCKRAEKEAWDDQRAAITRHAIALIEMLHEGGSAWRVVVEPRWALERRVGAAMRVMADEVREPGTDAAKAIGVAWRACYGLEPDYDKAYRHAVMAVEAVVLPLTSPKDRDATLGKAIAHIADTRSGWTVGGLDDERQESADTLLAMLKTLWHNQERHANNDGTITGVQREEAEVAVSLAVTLVHWFTSGLVTKE